MSQIRSAITCSIVGAMIVFVLCFLFCAAISYFVKQAGFDLWLLMSSMPAVITFISLFLLCLRDAAREEQLRAAVRRRLLSRIASEGEPGGAEQQKVSDGSLIELTKESIADFFDVPVQSIRATDDLRSVLAFDELEPMFHTSIIYRIFEKLKIQPESFVFRSGEVQTVEDLSAEFARIIEGFGKDPDDQELNSPDIRTQNRTTKPGGSESTPIDP